MGVVFNTDKRIKMGVWGLGRGKRIVDEAKILNIDVVAGCDINPHMRENFMRDIPGAFVTGDENEFLAQDFDVVLIATFIFDHARHTIKALEAGKHVLCEVTPFITPAEGVQVVEAVEKSGKIYNLMENYPFSKANLYLTKRWQEGFFGELMYGEFEYAHEVRTLSYAYNVDGGVPVEPGYTVHSWRPVLDSHYYNSHSFGAIMKVTGCRPASVSAVSCGVTLPGHIEDENIRNRGTLCPSIIKMTNGALVKNLVGASTGDYHFCGRLWGTKASAEVRKNDLTIRIGACGAGEPLKIKPEWPAYGEHAEKTDHGGADFWELYYFARQYFTGETAPWDIYSACDVALTGIMAARSTENNGVFMDVPDFRDKALREKYRNDHWKSRNFEFDTERIFPEGHDKIITSRFTKLMTDLYPLYLDHGIPVWNMAMDGMKLYNDTLEPYGKLRIIEHVERLVHCLPQLAEDCKFARQLADMYPDCAAGKTLEKVLASLDLKKIMDVENTLAELREFLENRYKIR
ncbi:MAG: Gfo/Idh/MocA family oxidoreductase [Lentisphaerae bacterium]|nr:Gfo/Idh/MocA family oxidoreductase [Lentisphaerota bacterium]